MEHGWIITFESTTLVSYFSMAVAIGTMTIGKLTFVTDNNVTTRQTTKTHMLIRNNNRINNRKWNFQSPQPQFTCFTCLWDNFTVISLNNYLLWEFATERMSSECTCNMSITQNHRHNAHQRYNFDKIRAYITHICTHSGWKCHVIKVEMKPMKIQ